VWFGSLLRPVPDGADDHSASLHAVKDNVWRATNHQLADSRLRAGSAEVGMFSQILDDGNNTRG